MVIPDMTSAEALERYIGGTVLRSPRGRAWKDIKAFIIAPPRESDGVVLPAVSEPFLAWPLQGCVDFYEREGNGPWLRNRIGPGDFFLTSGGAPYECRWRPLGAERFETMMVFLSLPVLQAAMREVFGRDADGARLRDLSGFRDPVLDALMQLLHAEVKARTASPLVVQGLAQTIAVHLARHYAEPAGRPAASPALPGFKLKQITDYLAAHRAEEFNLDRIARRVGLSKFHFLRLFKRATGVAPAQYHIRLRMDAARRLLRETERSVVEIALEVGYANPSHFAQLFRRENGLTPTEYRRQR